MNAFIEMFSHPFIVRALIVGVAVSLCSALVGVTLVLRRNSMIGDGLSHTAFGAFALAVVLGFTPIWFALPVVIIASFAVLRISQSRSGHGDSAIALLSASSLAIGTIAISVSGGVNIDLNTYLFGSILSASWSDVILSVILSVLVVAFYIFAHNKVFAITFNEEFAESIGIKTGVYDTIFAIICSVIVVLGMRLLGSLLISSLIIFPTASAMQIAKSFKHVVMFSAIISVIGFFVGMVISYFASTPTGATVVIVDLVMFLLLFISKRLK